MMKALKLEIETGVPVPQPGSGRGSKRKMRATDKYRIRELKAGQSVFVPNAKSKNLTGLIAGYRRRFKESYPTRKTPVFATRQMVHKGLKGVRIFRLT